MKIGLIVEGQGDVLALPVLVRRIAQEMAERFDVKVLQPMRVKRGRFSDSFDDYARASTFLATKADAVITVLDADDDCPVELGANLRSRAQDCIGHVQVAVTVANKEYETWLLAGVESLRGLRGVSEDAEVPANLEDIRGAKGRLASMMSGHYSETVDQPAMTAKVDLAEAQRLSASLDKFVRDLLAILEQGEEEDQDKAASAST